MSLTIVQQRYDEDERSGQVRDTVANGVLRAFSGGACLAASMRDRSLSGLGMALVGGLLLWWAAAEE